jgi:hypothetical protein
VSRDPLSAGDLLGVLYLPMLTKGVMNDDPATRNAEAVF